ncbi:MAG: isoprenyl transferase [Candidatus Omnitrophica bacterium]|nr:isoprenyl transferase [Candidatus Omnitrophota bacterium]
MNAAPNHIAIIMDGNGRWARRRGLPRTAGHRAGINKIKKMIKAADDLGVKILTLFAFSTENWNRPKREVDMLMRSLENFLDKEVADLNKNNIRLQVIGRDEPIPKKLLEKLKNAQETTKNNTGITVNLAFNYGARSEIVDAAKKIADEVSQRRYNLDQLNENSFSEFLYTAGLADPDLLIRTSGEMRISNFLLWQLSYAELYFTKKFWPDFDKKDLQDAIAEYESRDRRFGEVKSK